MSVMDAMAGMIVSEAVVRKALAHLPTENLQRGMRAFEHPPRMCWEPSLGEGDRTGCFMWEARYYSKPMHNGERLEFTVPTADLPDVLALSAAYEQNNAWFHGECLRELAERGVAAEPAAREAVPA